MSKLITDYIKVYNEYTQDELDLITDWSNDFNWKPHQWSNYDRDAGSRDHNELEVAFPPESISKLVMQKNGSACRKYASEFHFGAINGMSNPRFNRYTENTNMAKHVDHIHTLFDGTRKGIPVLSVLTIFNDDYKGGEFVFNDNDYYRLSAGDVIIFPSVFLFAHRVETVTEGSRLSAVSWTW